MPKWKVERASRTAFPAAADAPGPGAQRPGVRWALRALVIGALAGAAWLLTGVAAQAADHDPTAVGAIPDLSLIDSARPGDTTEPAVTGVLQAAAQPLDPDRQASTLDSPKRAVHRPARVGREITGTLRLTGGPVDSRLAPMTAPVIAALVPGTRGIRTVRTVTEPAPHAAVPARTADRPEVLVAAVRSAARTSGFVSRRHPVVTDWATGSRRSAARPAVAPETIRKASGNDGPADAEIRRIDAEAPTVSPD